jgi:uncharacterized beta-barrel protein YwiB (DUF1934 family)
VLPLQTSTAEQIPVKINVKTTIHQGDGFKPAVTAGTIEKVKKAETTETYELIAFGRYKKTASAVYIRYTEAMEVGNIDTTVKITDKETLILRNGAIKMRMIFHPGHQVSGTYHTPHGLMEIITDTKTLQYSFNEKTNEGQISLQYDLSMQGALAGTYDLEIKFKEERR